MIKTKCAAELEAAKARLFSCTSNKGFIQSLVTQFMPQFRRYAPKLIATWEATLNEDEIEKQQAYSELSQALSEIKDKLEILKKQHRQGCPQQQEWVIEFGIEDKLICETIQKQHSILFGHILLNNSAPKQFLVKGQPVPYLDPYDEIIEELCAKNSIFLCKEPPCTRFYDKIRSLHIYCVPESNGIKFAPAALKLFKKEQLNEFVAIADLEPAYSWLQLLWIENAWVKAEEPSGCLNTIGWGAILKDDRMWANADAAYQKALQNHRANDLWHFCHTNYTSAFLDIDRLKALINRLTLEISRPTLKGPPFQKKMTALAVEYCVAEIVSNVRNLSTDEQTIYGKNKDEIYNMLRRKAIANTLPFANFITRTVVEKKAYPKANKILSEEHGITWRKPWCPRSPKQ